jgi:hypothetical protein
MACKSFQKDGRIVCRIVFRFSYFSLFFWPKLANNLKYMKTSWPFVAKEVSQKKGKFNPVSSLR